MKSSLVLTVVLLTGARSWAEPAGVVPPIITRSDLAQALIRFERHYDAHRPAEADRARVHRAYDQAMMLYFSAKHADALAALNELTDSLGAPDKAPQNQALIRSLQVRVTPQLARSNRRSVMRIRIARMYSVPMEAPLELRLVIRSDAAQPAVVLDEPVKIDPVGPPFAVTRAQPKADSGRYVIELLGPDGHTYPQGHWFVTDGPLDSMRITNERRLSAVAATTPQVTHALVACRSRNMLLSDRRDENVSASFLADPIALPRDVNAEIDAMLQGQDPYVNRPGDLWRAILSGGMEIPSRVYAPQQVLDGKPLPLLIALHDLGGDESTFMQFIGNGRLKKLADEHGLLVVTPNVNWVTRNPVTSLESIVDAMSTVYAVDPAKLYLIGHGSGAVTAIQAASSQPAKVSKLVLFSAADFGGVRKLPPTRFYSGELDPLFAPQVAEVSMAQARHARLPVEMSDKKDSGHYLIVHDHLAEAVEWLVK
jgi:predicted esterase